MKRFFAILLCLLSSFGLGFSQDTEPTQATIEYEAKALVLVEVAKDFKPEATITVVLNAQASEAKAIQDLASKLSSKHFSVISSKDFREKYPDKIPHDIHAFNFEMTIVSCTPDDAILTGGTGLKVPGGWIDRFYLTRLNERWVLAGRINYEIN